MNEILQLVGLLALAFAASVGVSYVWVTLRRRSRVVLAPPVNATVRFKTGGAMYRSRFLGVSEDGWLLSPPLQRDHYVPIREGDEIRGELVTPSGVQLFRTTVLRREMSPPRLVFQVPDTMELRERRDTPRRRDLQGMKAGLDGETALLINLSTYGAKVATATCPERGERMALQLPWLATPVFAYVLESAPPADSECGGCEVRLRFEEALGRGLDDLQVVRG